MLGSFASGVTVSFLGGMIGNFANISITAFLDGGKPDYKKALTTSTIAGMLNFFAGLGSAASGAIAAEAAIADEPFAYKVLAEAISSGTEVIIDLGELFIQWLFALLSK